MHNAINGAWKRVIYAEWVNYINQPDCESQV